MSLWGTIFNMEKSKFIKCSKNLEINYVTYYAHNPHLRVNSNGISASELKQFGEDSYYLTTVFDIPRYNKKIPLIIHSWRRPLREDTNYFAYYSKFYVLYHSFNTNNSLSFFALPLNYKHKNFLLPEGKQNDKNFMLGKQNLKLIDFYRQNNLKFYVPNRLAFDDTVEAIYSSVKYKNLMTLFNYIPNNIGLHGTFLYDSNFSEWKTKLMNLLSKDNNLK